MASILRLTDGTTTISLLKGGDELGFHLNDWRPGVRVSDDQNVIETFDLKLDGASPNDLTHQIQELRRLLIKAKDYQDEFWKTTPFWIEAKQDCETNARYAPILDGNVPEDNNPYSQPFLQQDGGAVMDNLTLLVERGDWMANKPGESTCVQTSGLADLSYPSYIKFNATTTDIDCGSNAGIDDLPTGANGFTAEAWVRADDWGENNAGRIFDKREGASGWQLNIENTGGLRAHFDCAATDCNVQSGVDEFSPDSDWHHVATTYDDATKVSRLWIDGIEITSYLLQQTGAGAYVTDAARNLHIGNNTALNRTWDGDIGWSRLSSTIRYTATFTPPPRCTLPAIDANTVGQWVGAENGGATIDNQQGNPLWDGTLANGTFYCDCYGGDPACRDGALPPPWAITFNATTTNILIPDNAAIQNLPTAAGTLTAEAWIRPDGYGEGNFGRIFDKTASVADGWQFSMSNIAGLAAVVYTDTVDGQSTCGLDELTADGLWHHVCMQFTDALPGATLIYLWVDGRAVSSYAVQVGATGVYDADVGNDLYIGNRSNNDLTFDGDIGWCRLSSVPRYTNGLSFTPPDRCNLPTIDGSTVGQWIGIENAGATIDNQEGTAAIDGTLTDGVFVDECEDACDTPPEGQEATCNADVYITNKHVRAQITHIFTWSAANLFSPNLVGTWPYDLIDTVGAAPAVDDYVIFGIDTAQVNSGPFDSLVFDLTTVLAGGLIVDDWEYSDGGGFAWPDLTEQDNTWDGGAMTAGASSFDTIGVNSVHWLIESDWVPQAINGVTAYWVRAVVTAAPGGETAPVQGNRDVYTITEPYLEVAAAQVGGDLNALMRIEQRFCAYYTDKPGEYLIGVRDYARGAQFSAYLNWANEQNPEGVEVTVAGNASLAARVESPTGVALFYNPPGIEVAVSSANLILDEGITPQYRGTYHAFIRGEQDGGAAGGIYFTVSLRLGNLLTYERTLWESEQAEFGTVGGIIQAIDLGQITIPDFISEADQLNFHIALNNSDATPPDAWFYDIVLVPTDEWSGAFNMSPHTGGTLIRYYHTMVVDSLSDLRETKAVIVTKTPLTMTVGTGRKTTASPPALLANKRQRIWTFNHFPITTDDSSIGIAHRCQVWCNQRYLSMRGAR